ncbi:hypothetical protein CDL15_Pgr009219 [Punica granatum]|uniref:Uncharacterized protein n=1 Tax=Punica granatum TaxID=22663 RepID=A0A218WUY9_PUNGR|nr:hypothetical protein CDL15_Pgr009219 [Punica granatum]PKI48593.1 hypothetical protein CRG98_031012 [Punica granatum]
MGCKLSTSQHSSSNRRLKISDHEGGHSISSTSRPRGSTVLGLIKSDCLKVGRKKRQLNLNPRDDKVETVVKKMIIEEQKQKEKLVILNPDPPEEKITALTKKQMQMTLEDWLRGSPSPKLEHLMSSSELCVLKAFSRKVHPSTPRSTTCNGLGDEDKGRTTGKRLPEKSKKKELREISGSFESACDYFRALDGLESAAAVKINPFLDRSLDIDNTQCPRQEEKHLIIERRCKIDGREEEDGTDNRSSRRVTFRSPKESDIIVFYSPKDRDDESVAESDIDENCKCEFCF